MIDSKLLLDSSIWISYFQREKEEVGQIVENPMNYLYTSSLSLYEVVKKLNKKKVSQSLLKEMSQFMKERSHIVDVTANIAEGAFKETTKHNLHAIDALIYRSALENKATLVTMDYDFHKLPHVKIIKQD